MDTSLALQNNPVEEMDEDDATPFDKLREECGVMAIYNHPDAARMTYWGLYSLQHRGQESGGIASADGQNVNDIKGMGLVSEIFTDDVLAKLGFGRAHHRVLHFVNRNPGMKVAELLDVLKITKQSLARVLRQLIQEGYILQREGANDRRQRLLYVTPKGEALAMKLAGLQTKRIMRALAELGPTGHETAGRFLAAMLNSEHRESVLRFIARAERGRRSRV